MKFLPFHIACKQAVRLGELGKGHETAARALCGEPEVKVMAQFVFLFLTRAIFQETFKKISVFIRISAQP